MKDAYVRVFLMQVAARIISVSQLAIDTETTVDAHLSNESIASTTAFVRCLFTMRMDFGGIL